jgi:hypothetical protein
MKGTAGGARDRAALLPAAPGVYRFRDAAGRVLYLGRATHLRSRVASYWSDLRDRAHLAPMVYRVARVEAVACDSGHEAAWLERNLLQARKPPWNRLSDDARDPGVTVVYQPAERARNFGPYLGGRQAVSGLCRVLPLNYAGGDLRLGGRHPGALRDPGRPPGRLDAPRLRRGDGPPSSRRDAPRMDGLLPAQRRARRPPQPRASGSPGAWHARAVWVTMPGWLVMTAGTG